MIPITATRRIVVIEDDPAILRGLADNLRAESYDVLTAANGEEGYHLALENQPDLIILDLMLPRMNGYEVCRQLRGHGVATPVLMLTAQAQESQRVAGFEAGTDDYMTKPFSIRELLGRVRAILRRSEGRTDLATQREMDDARQIQRRLMPDEVPQIDGCRIAAVWRPARIVSGDYFDVIKLHDGGVAVCIADVCGKGLPAALMMANLQAVVKTCTAKGMRPKDLCETANRVICGNMAAKGFISFFYGVISRNATEFTYCNAGHNPPIFCGKASLSQSGMVLGVRDGEVYLEESVALKSGNHIVLYTDGITESRNPEGEEFSEHRLFEVLRRAPSADAGALAEAVIGAATDFSRGAFADDLTVVAISVD